MHFLIWRVAAENTVPQACLEKEHTTNEHSRKAEPPTVRKVTGRSMTGLHRFFRYPGVSSGSCTKRNIVVGPGPLSSSAGDRVNVFGGEVS